MTTMIVGKQVLPAERDQKQVLRNPKEEPLESAVQFRSSSKRNTLRNPDAQFLILSRGGIHRHSARWRVEDGQANVGWADSLPLYQC